MPRILLVDDDPEILEIMSLELMDDTRFSVDTCRSSDAALEKAGQCMYDVIVSDLHMPGKDGASLVKELRNRKCGSLIIIYSGHDLGGGIRRALDSGADHFISRRGDPEKEFAELHELINKGLAGPQGTAEKPGNR